MLQLATASIKEIVVLPRALFGRLNWSCVVL